MPGPAPTAVIAAKMSVVAAAGSGAMSALAAVDGASALPYGIVGAVLALGGVFVREISKNEKRLWAIINERDKRVEELAHALEYTTWEREVLRFRLNERPTDPGPFVPRRET